MLRINLSSDGLLHFDCGVTASISDHWLGIVQSADAIVRIIHLTIMDLATDGQIDFGQTYELLPVDFHGFSIPYTRFFWENGYPAFRSYTDEEIIDSYEDSADELVESLVTSILDSLASHLMPSELDTYHGRDLTRRVTLTMDPETWQVLCLSSATTRHGCGMPERNRLWQYFRTIRN